MGNPRNKSASIWIFRLLAAVIVICAFTYTPYHLYRRSGFAKYAQLRADLDAMLAQNRQLEGDIDELGREAEALTNDPRAIEHVARHELGWVRPGDVLIDFSER